MEFMMLPPSPHIDMALPAHCFQDFSFQCHSSNSSGDSSCIGSSSNSSSWTQVPHSQENMHVVDARAKALISLSLLLGPDRPMSYPHNARCHRELQRAASAEEAPNRHPTTWNDLEHSCKELDAAHIRISSLDLTCMEEEDCPPPPTPNQSQHPQNHNRRHSQEQSTSPEVAQSCSLPGNCNGPPSLEETNGMEAHLPAGFAPPPLRDTYPSPALSIHRRKLLQRVTTSHHYAGESGSWVLNPACSSAPSSPPLITKNQACSASNTATHPRIALLPSKHFSAGDGQTNIHQAPKVRSDGIAAQDAVPERATGLGSPVIQGTPQPSAAKGGKLQRQGTEAPGLKFPQDPFEPTVKPTCYTSLVLPGAIPRDQTRLMGMSRYIHAVKAKFGMLYTKQRKPPS